MNCDIDIRNAVEAMRKGGVVLYPTDTVWGIGCDATNEAAVRRVFEIKRREDNRAMLCLVDSADRLQRYFRRIPDVAWDLMDCATEPLTLVLQGASGVAPSLVAEDGSLGVRVTKDEFSRQMCFRLQRPIVSTSANISGEPTPAFFKEINGEIVSQMDYVVQFRRGDTTRRKPSHIVKLDLDGAVTIIRR
ncbi:MAG: threonylcarbamoyl-AMP synthase [Prevotellaceae bacterium]|nr:threonylcarbamoyl-AMP synthase [Prevotellaceae bacterium]MCD8304661.1 threonylcarbamoyl-AMP synthase [Prevotellaceae bacterium]